MTIAIITGGSRRLGRNAALHLAANKVDIILTYRGNEAEARTTAKAVEEKGARAAIVQLDVAQPATFAAFAKSVSEILQGWGAAKFDYLVNNGGSGSYGSIAEAPEAQLDEMFAIHFKGPFLLTQALLPLIADKGRILNISSGLARFSLPGFAAYGSMKAALETLTRYQAQELGPRGISVNALAPGAIETDFGGGAVRDNKEINDRVANDTALGRVGLPDDIGGAIAALLSPGTNWINGQRIEVSGGIYL